MATTYAELQTEIADFLNRQDLTSVIPTFIDLAEAQINRDIRHWQMEDRQLATATEQYLTKPSDWVESIRLHVTGSGTSVVNLISRDEMADRRQQNENVAGTPMYYCHSGNTIELYPTPDESTELELLYYAKIPALSDGNTSNWLLADSPDIYLYGALAHTAGYLHEDARIGTWGQLYAAAVQRLNLSSEKARFSGSGLTMKIRGY